MAEGYRIQPSEGLSDAVEAFGKALSEAPHEEFYELHKWCPAIGEAFNQYSAALWELQKDD